VNPGGEQARCTASLADDGFCFVDGATMRGWLGAHGPLEAWEAFADSWNDLATDPYLAAHGRQRRRRHGAWRCEPDGEPVRQPHQPHYQALAYNALQGGIERWFEPIAAGAAESAPLRSVLRFAVAFFGRFAPEKRSWRIEVHQFRIEATAGRPGEPTPEGVHRDGVDYVLVLLVDRQNIASGTTTIHAPDGRALGSFTLAAPFDAALVDDHRVFHGVTPVSALDPAKAAHRDVLVVTLLAEGTVPAE
jgi:hypothetical protein